MSDGSQTFDVLLREAIDRRGLSLARLRHHLRRRGHDLSIATLSYWRRGLSRPTRASSLSALSALEEILELPYGALAATLAERITPDGSGAPGLNSLAEELGLAWSTRLAPAGVHDWIALDRTGRQVRHDVRMLVTAREDGADRFPFAYWVEGEAEYIGIEKREGCDLGRCARNTTGLVAEIVLPHPLKRGEAWMSEVSLVIRGQALPMTHWGRCVTSETRIVHFTIDFHPDNVPMSAEKVTSVRGVSTRRPLVLPGPRVELHAEDFGPGDLGMEWSW